jgi:hypothetical protein
MLVVVEMMAERWELRGRVLGLRWRREVREASQRRKMGEVGVTAGEGG